MYKKRGRKGPLEFELKNYYFFDHLRKSQEDLDHIREDLKRSPRALAMFNEAWEKYTSQ